MSELEPFIFDDLLTPGRHEIGPGVTLRALDYGDEVVGFILEHPRDESSTGRCGGVFWTKRIEPPVSGINQKHVWTVVEREPLTLTPSLLCRGVVVRDGPVCTFHGFIQQGAWVAA